MADESGSQSTAAAMAVFGEEQAALDEAGVPAGVLPVGSPLPDGDLLDAVGNATSARQAMGGRPAVIVFYRGAWCPFCNLALRTYQEQVAGELERRGVALIAISPQKPDGSLSMRDKHELTFAVLSDPGNQIARGLGITTAPAPDVRAAQQQLGLDVAPSNADGTATIPMPTVVVVDRDGVIRWIDVHPNYARRTEPEQILRAVAEHL
ncbi:MAG: redoxin domain-containing protein [Actinophytocola sp.]|uniref:peroxiredoxin-like family protein n=1 Tax=Actinophytocola sp. TaxID=1872138 RepID=UPI001321BC2B|nr:peroxiredoxin-like family protein [Actinophytocola sp.]MPZ86450.1 redoxin domain-containing protein [Actinophytocola sp.]